MHADIAQSLSNLGNVYVGLGGSENLKRAIDDFEDSLKIFRQVYPSGVHLDIARTLGNLSYARLLAGEATEALRDARAAVQIAPGEVRLRGVEAHALLLLGRLDEALAIYAQYREQPVSARKTFRSAVLDDFAALRKAGVNDPGMATVEALYGQPAGQPVPR